MIAAVTISLLYVSQLATKALLAERYATPLRRASAPHSGVDVSILQPILSGDPDLKSALEANITNFPEARFIWLVDTDDDRGIIICDGIRQGHQARAIEVIHCAPPPQGINPKAFKLAAGLDAVGTGFLAVLDDDTRLTGKGLSALIEGLRAGAALATGLPRYRAAQGRWSPWLAEFVNSAAVLAYLPALAIAQPVSINGMCYALRTRDARDLDVFRAIQSALTDDLALAKLLSRKGLSIHQTIEPHDIATSIGSISSLGRLLHRWFVFARLLFEDVAPGARVGIGAAYAVPPLLLWGLAFLAPLSWMNVAALAATFALRTIIISLTQKRFLGPDTRHNPIASFLLELMQPILLVGARVRCVIQWRKRRILVRGIDDFEYL